MPDISAIDLLLCRIFVWHDSRGWRAHIRHRSLDAHSIIVGQWEHEGYRKSNTALIMSSTEGKLNYRLKTLTELEACRFTLYGAE